MQGDDDEVTSREKERDVRLNEHFLELLHAGLPLLLLKQKHHQDMEFFMSDPSIFARLSHFA